jgi:uncharacterized protein (DUF1810 family)
MTAGPFDLQRFVEAQEPVFATVLQELSSGAKRSHWMWFIFPQLAGLGRSAMALRYAIGSVEEARAYLDHSVLGERLRECGRLVLGATAVDAHAIFGSPDDLKFHSSMTLFERADPDEPVFRQCLDRFFGGRSDSLTLTGL